ncbi:MAG: hypothetical protein PHF86_14455 [Candidatus Nanoarchaeia archaeon]|nr:hypothetical protein [Candidatus Nanoarchaeia archaeon]
MKTVKINEEDEQFLDNYYTSYVLIQPGEKPKLFPFFNEAMETKTALDKAETLSVLIPCRISNKEII